MSDRSVGLRDAETLKILRVWATVHGDKHLAAMLSGEETVEAYLEQAEAGTMGEIELMEFRVDSITKMALTSTNPSLTDKVNVAALSKTLAQRKQLLSQIREAKKL